MYIAVSQISDNNILSTLLSVIWGVIILTLDRYIISGITKTGGKLKDFFVALPRLIFGFFISAVITKPIQLKLLEPRILAYYNGKENISFLDKINALSELTRSSNSDSSIFWLTYLLISLFFVIEVAPVLVRLLASEGLYDLLAIRFNNIYLKDKFYVDVKTGNIRNAINYLFFISGQQSDAGIKEIIEVSKRYKSLINHIEAKSIDEQFAENEISRIKNELTKIYLNIYESADDASKLKIDKNKFKMRMEDLPHEALKKIASKTLEVA